MLFSKTVALAFFTYFLSLRFGVVLSLVTSEQPGYYIDDGYNELTEEIYSRIKNKNHLSSSEAADYYYRIGYYSKAFPWYYQAAKKNDGYSQNRVGEMYQVNQEYTGAMLWYMRAHNNGILSATYNISTLYCSGLGVKQDYHIGLKWYLEAPNEGHSISQYEIGLHYEYGIGVQVNLLYSLMWYQKAAIQGHPGAKIKVRRLNNKGFHIADARNLGFIQ